MTYDEDEWLVKTEYTQRRVDSFIGDTNAWYATFGYRFGTVMLYFTYATVWDPRNTEADALPTPSPELAVLKDVVSNLTGINTWERFETFKHALTDGLPWRGQALVCPVGFKPLPYCFFFGVA
ncbi:hypothetical protein [Chitinimonas sp. BJB300]|uniref:hypothetical protein n=1 Tax=Chitinimonas sp. BJB300 TaxID=1559339 RepID=UPI001642E1D3|nr:hypothetical protein [Chitinimonas sp. BJB300]